MGGNRTANAQEGERVREREDGRQTERNWRREIPSVSVIVSCCQTLGNEREKE